MVWARLKVVAETALSSGAFPTILSDAPNGAHQPGTENQDPIRSSSNTPRERVINFDQVVWWTGGGTHYCVLALSNGQAIKVLATQTMLEILTGTCGSDLDFKDGASRLSVD